MFDDNLAKHIDAAWLRVIGELGWAGQPVSTPELNAAFQELSQVRQQAGLPALGDLTLNGSLFIKS